MVDFDLGRFRAFVEDYKATKAHEIELLGKLADASNTEVVVELKEALESAQAELKAFQDADEIEDAEYEAEIAAAHQQYNDAIVHAAEEIAAKDAALNEAVELKNKYQGELAAIVEELDKVFPAPAPAPVEPPVVEPTPEPTPEVPPVVEEPAPVVETPVEPEPEVPPVVETPAEPTPEPAPVVEPPVEEPVPVVEEPPAV